MWHTLGELEATELAFQDGSSLALRKDVVRLEKSEI
jgi:hypothetical protein